jgi:hypothetical protein
MALKLIRKENLKQVEQVRHRNPCRMSVYFIIYLRSRIMRKSTPSSPPPDPRAMIIARKILPKRREISKIMRRSVRESHVRPAASAIHNDRSFRSRRR